MSAFAAPKSFTRRDALRENEKKQQAKWDDLKVWEVDPEDGREKYFLNFPYPYMNGRLHLGHAFSLTKTEFTARFQRLQGKKVLYPFGFHCTGMPIQAASKKLREELEKYGCPLYFQVQMKLNLLKVKKKKKLVRKLLKLQNLKERKQNY